MAIYNAATGRPVESPDLSSGYLVDGTIITGYALEAIPGTITDSRPGGIKRRVPVTEPCQWYYPNPPEQDTAEPTQVEDVDKKIQAAVAPVYKALMEVI